jgi:hypothetical protein
VYFPVSVAYIGANGLEEVWGLTVYDSPTKSPCRAILVVSGETTVPQTLAHEVGHLLGLSHHEDPNNVMSKIARTRNQYFTYAQLTQLRTAAVSYREKCGFHIEPFPNP